MYNEANHVVGFVEDIAAQDYEGHLEVIVADGVSTDGSVERLRAAAVENGIDVLVLSNPERWVSSALNRCIERATGDLLIRLDCHSRYPPDYVSRCVMASEATGATNVGGIFVPHGRTPTERAVACALESPFGGVHWTRHRGDARVESDTVPYGAFRPEAFEMAGGFDESLVRNQDDEFNLRLRRAGGTVVLDPSIRIHYTPRGTFRKLARQYYEYGLWKPVVMRKHGRVVSMRSLAPVALVGTLVALLVAGLWSSLARWALAAAIALYLGCAVVAAAYAVRKRREPWSLLPRVTAVFPTFHISYGVGMLAGLVRAARTPRSSPALSSGTADRRDRPEVRS